MTAAWCEAVGIDFKPEALRWDTGKASELTWYETGTWHDNLARSTTLSRQQRDYVGLSTTTSSSPTPTTRARPTTRQCTDTG